MPNLITSIPVDTFLASANLQEMKVNIEIENVENTALSTWAGSASITTLGTIGTGVWQGTPIGDSFLSASLTGKTYNGLSLTAAAIGFTVAGGTTSKTLTISNTISFSGSDGASLNIGSGGTLGTAAFTASGAYQPNDATLTALAGYNTNGLICQTASDTFAGRTISGTADKITVTDGDGVGGNPTITISSSYSGQTSIITLGTIGTGIWQASAVGVAYGGTSATTAAGAATNLGLGTSSSPEFLSVKIGHSTDTEITRVSAGVAAIAGSQIITASGLGLNTKVSMPTATVNSGASQQFAIDGPTGELAIYVPGTGWIFFAGYQK